MLAYFENLEDLITFEFLANIPDCDDPGMLKEEDADTIIDFFPSLRVLAVALATFEFFTRILEAPELEDLTLNAYFWVSGDRDASPTPCPHLHSLCFNGIPDHWVPGPNDEGKPWPDAVKRERFPNIATLEVVSGPGDVFYDPSWIGV